MKIPKRKIFGEAMIILILLAGTALRFTNVNWDSYQAFHPDERNISWAVTRIQWFTQLNPKFFAYGGLPIYLYKILSDMTAWVTGDLSWTTEWGKIAVVGRYVSATLSSVSIFLIFLAARRLFSPTVGILASFFLAFSPWAIREAHFSTTETMLVFFLLSLLLTGHLIITAKYSPAIYKLCVVAGIIAGFAVGAKTTSLLFLIIPLLSVWLPSLDNKIVSKQFLRDIILRRIPMTLSLLVVASVCFLLTSPYTVLDYPHFWESMKYETGVALGRFSVPYTLQFFQTTPYIYQIQTMLWQSGIVILPGLVGMMFLIIKYLRRREKTLILFLAFPLIYYAFSGQWLAKFSRYNVPFLPFATIAAAWLMVTLYKRFRTAGLFCIAFTACVTLVWGLSNWTIYLRPQTRIEASRWMYRHIAPNTVIFTEHWNDGLPGSVPNMIEVPFNRELLNVYDDDNDAKLVMYQDTITRGQYIILSTRRIWATMPKLTKKYPYTSTFYKRLFDGSLGFQEVASFTSYPQLFGMSVNDDSAEESIQVFDHPTVKIFQKTTPLSRDNIRSQLKTGQ